MMAGKKKQVEDPYKNFMKDLQITQEKKTKSQQTVESYCQGVGFKMLNGSNQQSCSVVMKQYARETFEELIARCMALVPTQKEFIQHFLKMFSRAIDHDFERRIFSEIDPSKKHITVIKVFFYKKPLMCLMSHRVLILDYSLSPHIMKIKSLNEKSSSTGIKVGGFGFSSSSSSSVSTEKLEEIQRGITHQDLDNLMLLATVDNTNLLKILDEFHNNKIEMVDY